MIYKSRCTLHCPKSWTLFERWAYQTTVSPRLCSNKHMLSSQRSLQGVQHKPTKQNWAMLMRPIHLCPQTVPIQCMLYYCSHQPVKGMHVQKHQLSTCYQTGVHAFVTEPNVLNVLFSIKAIIILQTDEGALNPSVYLMKFGDKWFSNIENYCCYDPSEKMFTSHRGRVVETETHQQRSEVHIFWWFISLLQPFRHLSHYHLVACSICLFILIWHHHVYLAVTRRDPGVCLPAHTLLPLVQDVGFRVTHPQACTGSPSHTQKTRIF